ncbi:MAG: SIMPL domain-containing protein [Acidobacteria bacterium]|nr:SIMPL domain-containing protein [Acidobacteriota bacterium]
MKLKALLNVAALLLALAPHAAADDKPEPRLITVTGEAEVLVVPDEVVFDLTVQTLNKELRLAKAQSDERLKKLIDLTRRFKVDPKDVQTDYIKLEPRYRGNDESRLFIGYSVRKDLVFTLRDVTRAEELLSEILESGITRVNGVRFQTSQLRKYRDQARASAIRAAQEKATALTAEIGQRIGKAYSIEETTAPTRGYYAPNVQNIIEMSGSEAPASEGTLSLGQIKVTARVTVRFELL